MTVIRANQISGSIDNIAKTLIGKINEAEEKDEVEGIIQIRVGAAKKILNWIVDYKSILIESDVCINEGIDKNFGTSFLKSYKKVSDEQNEECD